MKRQVWVGCVEDDKEAKPLELYTGQWTHVKKIEIHESHWIPVSEKPEQEGRYPVVFDSQREFEGSSSYWDGNNWCGPVKLWIEAPPLPVEDGFECWYAKHLEDIKHADKLELARSAWNAAKESK